MEKLNKELEQMWAEANDSVVKTANLIKEAEKNGLPTEHLYKDLWVAQGVSIGLMRARTAVMNKWLVRDKESKDNERKKNNNT